MARAAAALLLLLCGCSGASATTPAEPRRFDDYKGTSSSASDQCSLPVEERTGGWFCPHTK